MPETGTVWVVINNPPRYVHLLPTLASTHAPVASRVLLPPCRVVATTPPAAQGQRLGMLVACRTYR